MSTASRHARTIAFVVAMGIVLFISLPALGSFETTIEWWEPTFLATAFSARTGSAVVVESNITIEGETTQLPSAKNLLIRKPPFEDSQAIKLSDTLIKSPNTVVTGYFRVRSKYPSQQYDKWMMNMLSVQDAMVIFTENEMVEQIKKFRRHAENRTVIIPLELDQLPYGTLYSKEFWDDQLNRDPEKRIHRSYELFWIWLSKSWLTTQAIRMNWFDSNFYVWSDIGCFRRGEYNHRTLVQHPEVVPPTEMMQMAHREPFPPPEELYYDKYSQPAHFYHSGSMFAAYKETWLKFHELFLNTIDRFLMKKMIIVEDQVVLQSTCLSHPEICVYLPTSEVSDNNYFGLRMALHNGGNYRLWRHNKTRSVETF
jgi:Bacterial protein of unknown function (HtrL_YibB)